MLLESQNSHRIKGTKRIMDTDIVSKRLIISKVLIIIMIFSKPIKMTFHAEIQYIFSCFCMK